MKTVDQNYKADNATGRNHEGDSANTPLKRLTSTSIVGDRVENPEGESLGKISDLMVNLPERRVEYVVIQFGSVMGMGGKLFAIPFNEFRVDAGRKVFVIDRDKEYLKKSPGFDQHHWPDTNDPRHVEYWDNVTRHYKTPVFPISLD